jgi:hypothetical protein
VSENLERLATGPKGPKGPKGDRGEGMTRGARHAVIFLFVFSMLLAGMGLLFTAREVNAVRAAGASTVQLCQAGNEARAQQIALWEFILRVSGPPRSARERAVTAAFIHHLHVIFAPRNCASLGQAAP